MNNSVRKSKNIISNKYNSIKYNSIKYNSTDYNILNSDKELLITVTNNDNFTVQNINKKRPIITILYKNYTISSNNILFCYVVLQHIFKVDTIQKLSELDWDYTCWKLTISSEKPLSDHLKILNCLLNLHNSFNKPITVGELESMVKLKDKRGWGGERPREIYYKFGFPLFTSKTMKSLKNSQRLFKCPFPVCKINPERVAILSKNQEKKCFTCGAKEGDKNYFGNICYFEKGHLEPHILGSDNTATYQCKLCNSFYKDKISWNKKTGKPSFNTYAILRDAPKKVVIENLKKLGFTAKDLD